MKRDSLKRNIWLALALLASISSSQIIHAVPISEPDRDFIHQITGEINMLINETKGILKAFVDANDKRSIVHYRQLLQDKLNTLVQKIHVPVKNKLNELANSDEHVKAYYFSLKITEDILTDLQKQIVNLQKVINDSHNCSKPLILANALEKYVKTLTHHYDVFDVKLKELHDFLLQLDLPNLANEITQVGILLQIAKKEQQRELSLAEKARIVAALKIRLTK